MFERLLRSALKKKHEATQPHTTLSAETIDKVIRAAQVKLQAGNPILQPPPNKLTDNAPILTLAPGVTVMGYAPINQVCATVQQKLLAYEINTGLREAKAAQSEPSKSNSLK